MAVAPNFYSSETPALQQGDILFAPIGRLEAGAQRGPGRWATLDKVRRVIAPAVADTPQLSAVAGFGLVMATTHECHMDIEFRARVKELLNAGASLDEAIREADEDPDLDRFINVSPLVPPSAITGRSEADLMAGRVTGFFAVPAYPDHGIFAGVIDLSYKATIDREAIVGRNAVLNEDARTRLRYALARFEALRTPRLGFDLESIIGKSIKSVDSPSRDPLTIVFELSDGEVIRLLKPPGSGADDEVARSLAPPERH